MSNLNWPAPRTIALPEHANRPAISLAVYEAGSGPAVVFCHGFPELAYSWRHQLPAVAAAGFRAIAPDQRGYGGSTAPAAVTDYGISELTGDLVGLLDALRIDRAIFVGHDWGGFIAWAMPVMYPERTAGVIGVCTPYIAFPPLAVMRALVGGKDERFYILWFQEPGRAETVMDPKARLIFDRLMRAPIDPGVAASQMMADGELVAGFAAAAGIGRSGSPTGGWKTLENDYPDLFPNAAELEAAWYARTGIYPMHGTIVVKDSVLAEHPWVAKSLFDANGRYPWPADGLMDLSHS